MRTRPPASLFPLIAALLLTASPVVAGTKDFSVALQLRPTTSVTLQRPRERLSNGFSLPDGTRLVGIVEVRGAEVPPILSLTYGESAVKLIGQTADRDGVVERYAAVVPTDRPVPTDGELLVQVFYQ